MEANAGGSRPSGWRSWASTVVLGLIILVTFVIGGLSVNFVEDPFPSEALLLITSFALGMTSLAVVALYALARYGSRSAWLGLWAYPVFFLWHVIVLKTYVPDLVLALIATAGLLIVWPFRPAAATRSPGPSPRSPGAPPPR